jgi:hypothetical protein
MPSFYPIGRAHRVRVQQFVLNRSGSRIFIDRIQTEEFYEHNNIFRISLNFYLFSLKKFEFMSKQFPFKYLCNKSLSLLVS